MVRLTDAFDPLLEINKIEHLTDEVQAAFDHRAKTYYQDGLAEAVRAETMYALARGIHAYIDLSTVTNVFAPLD